MSERKIVKVSLKTPYTKNKSVSSHEEIEIRLQAALDMAQCIDKSTYINSVIIDIDKSLKIHRRKRWWQVWKIIGEDNA